MSSITYPAEWQGRQVYTLDLLLFLREKSQQGLILDMFMGSTHVQAMAAFVSGSVMALRHNGLEDREYFQFVEWLRDVKDALPPEGWPAKYLRDCGGDHRAAIARFLDYAAEFRAARR